MAMTKTITRVLKSPSQQMDLSQPSIQDVIIVNVIVLITKNIFLENWVTNTIIIILVITITEN